jgi:hypothetical protein
MIIPGGLIATATFPGVIVHEWAHLSVCRLLRIPVFEVCYFRFRFFGAVGYVRHGVPAQTWQSLLIGFGPMLINTLLGILIALPCTIHAMVGNQQNVLDLLLWWAGVSIAMHSFPSRGDAASIWKSVVENPQTPLLEKIVTVPFIGMIWAGAIGSIFWLDAIYGLIVVCFVPGWVINIIAAL